VEPDLVTPLGTDQCEPTTASNMSAKYNYGTFVFALFSVLSLTVSITRGIVPIYLAESVLWGCLAWYWHKKGYSSQVANASFLALAAIVFAGNGYSFGQRSGYRNGYAAASESAYQLGYKEGVNKGYNVGFGLGGAYGYSGGYLCAAKGGVSRPSAANASDCAELAEFIVKQRDASDYKDQVLSLLEK
jgi:hypothetical protein